MALFRRAQQQVSSQRIPAEKLKQRSDGLNNFEKLAIRQGLEAKGVSTSEAQRLAGEGESVTREQLALRRVEWQKTLPKAR